MGTQEDPPLTGVEAFVALYRAHAEALLVFFARRTLDAEVAAELTAETFAEALASRHRFRDHGAGPAPWLDGIAQHQLSHYHRQGRARGDCRTPRPADGAPPFETLHEGTIVPGSERHVLSIRTLRGTTASLFVARTSRGKLCAVTRAWQLGGSCCWDEPAAGSPFEILAPSSFTPHRADTRRALFGRTADARAATLRVTYGDGTHDDVALAGGSARRRSATAATRCIR